MINGIIIDLLAGAVIVAAGLYLVALGVICFIRASSAAKFLLGHAGSGFLHFLELSLRLLLGASLVQRAPALVYPPIFSVFGWILIITTVMLFLVPWRWHRQFAVQVVPYALRYIKLLGISSIALGILLTAFVLPGSAAQLFL